jgi:hypothetical protein
MLWSFITLEYLIKNGSKNAIKVVLWEVGVPEIENESSVPKITTRTQLRQRAHTIIIGTAKPLGWAFS